jgi:hypothetical protein
MGCADKSGALLVVDGNGAIKFDRVEFYFGKEIGGPMPTSPKHPQPTAGSSIVAKRLFVDADVYSPGGTVGTLRYYVPERTENENLGNYVAVLAFSGEQLVGIGELFDFEVTTTGGAVYRYAIDLVDPQNEDLERWGRPTVDCMRWTRDRGGGPRTVAVVRDDDTDCDAFVEGSVPDADCLPRVYCDGLSPTACEAGVLCVSTSSSNSCNVGTAGCSNISGHTSQCAASVCIDEIACRDCSASDDPAMCVVMNNSIHVDAPFRVHPDYTLCAEPFYLDVQMPTGVGCGNPTIVEIANYLSGDPFAYEIAGSATTCRITITPAMPGARFTAVPHMLIEIDTPTGVAPRTGFVLGIQGATNNACRTPDTITPQLSFGSCIR